MALILVTGASAGLGLANVSALAEAGHDVVLHARNADRIADQSVRAACAKSCTAISRTLTRQ